MKSRDSEGGAFVQKTGGLLMLAGLLGWAFSACEVLSVEEDHTGHDHAGGIVSDQHVAEDPDDHADHEHSEKEEEPDHNAEEHDEHAENGEHAGHAHSEHSEKEGLRLTDDQKQRFGIVVQAAGPGSLRSEVTLPGEIVFNEDRVVHMVPRVAGIASRGMKTVGDDVKEGEVLAVIESRELADAKSEYLAASARSVLAEKTFRREKELHDKQVSSEQDYLEAEQALAEAKIEVRSAKQKLHAIGLSQKDVNGLVEEHDEEITRYELRSPIDGVITEKHISIGESLDADADVFTVVDTDTVWVHLAVYAKDLDVVRAGQAIVISVDHNDQRASGKISMVTPFIDESTRSATARVVLDNGDDRWIPGTFVTGSITVSEKELPVVVPREAVQHIDGRDVVFVEHEGAYEMTTVTTGRSDRNSIEVVSGLEVGTSYVSGGAFQLKATVITSALGSHAGHGH